MWHPQTINGDLDEPYFVNYLNHVSHRSDVWYVNLGHLYLYHILQLPDRSGPTGVSAGSGLPTAFGLSQDFPKPFNPSTSIAYTVGGIGNQASDFSDVRLVVYDLLGREVAMLVNERKAPGKYQIRFDAAGLASGVYICRLEAGNFVQTRKLVLLR